MPKPARPKAGSSPRTRGTLRAALAQKEPSRFIPAHAGNARSRLARTSAIAVHPRARGERTAPTGSRMPRCGSSPRTRGTHRSARPTIRRSRFIPAHAGNAQEKSLSARRFSVHPRARGERPTPSPAPSARGGSSPRTRGTLIFQNLAVFLRRFIPAHAGNASSSPPASSSRSVHPRARGERAYRWFLRTRFSGSSPRTRGTPVAAQFKAGGRRFIPAHAGNAKPRSSKSRRRAVHPRARGERMPQPALMPQPAGSSPRTRGTLVARHAVIVMNRFIPAHAGNAALAGYCSAPATVHPRARGERVKGV